MTEPPKRRPKRIVESPLSCPHCAGVWGVTVSAPVRESLSGQTIGEPGRLRSCAECMGFYLVKDDGSVSACGPRLRAKRDAQADPGGVRTGQARAFDEDMTYLD